ncbi:calponin homology domain-containing protein DDB_G0272472-like [Mytilus trossulus]|uniref:calponin homology domain-containing protein DDB_G0272472-like n=1 Tax=Mytilus trossulus TaxID=6551 RepID=UPI0030049132
MKQIERSLKEMILIKEIWRDKENFHIKERLEKNEDYRRAEAESKKCQRKNSAIRQMKREKELASKREARKDENYRMAEAESKKSQRENSDLRQMERQRELASKRRARKNKDFNIRELASKREARKDKNYRRAEAESKKSQRENSDIRQMERERELASKRRARKNKDFNIRELASKREARKDKNYKRAEAESKKSQRENSDIRQMERERELASKRQARKNKDFNIRELAAKRKARKNEDFKRNETEKKKNARQDENYRKHESKRDFHRKQEYRSHPENLENERLKKQSCRQKNLDIDRYYDKTVKSAKRKNIDFTDHEKDLKKKRVQANKMGFPQRPKELNLYPLEERLLSLRIPFMQIRQLPRGGQLSVKGNVVNVPVEVQPTINSLPHTLEKSGTISVKLKKKLEFKKCDFSENVRPFAVICALHYLMRTRDLYKSSGIEINEDWITEIAETNEKETQNEKNSTEQDDDQDQNDSEDDSDHFSEVDEKEIHVGNTDTLLDHIPDDNPLCDTGFTFAPGEGQRPISLYSDPDAECLSFPTIFCGKKKAR